MHYYGLEYEFMNSSNRVTHLNEVFTLMELFVYTQVLSSPETLAAVGLFALQRLGGFR